MVMPPAESLTNFGAVEVANAEPRTFSVRVPLWSREEGRSEFELITATEVGSGLWSARMDDLLLE